MSEESKEKKQFFSVIVPIYNEERYIEKCLGSLLDQDYPKEMYEIIAVDGGSNDRSMEIARRMAKSGKIKVFENPAKIAASAINIGIKNSKGEIITRVDAHSYVEKDYLSSAEKVFQRTGEKVVGGPVHMVKDTPFRKASAIVLHSKLGVGSVPYRTMKQSGYVDSIQTGSYKREVLEKVGFFDESLPPGEDFDLNARVRRKGYKILLDPSIKFHYYPRDNYSSLVKQYFHYGRVKPIVLFKNPQAFKLKYIIPSMFLLYILATFFILFFSLLFESMKLELALSFWLINVLYLLIILLFSISFIPKIGFRLAILIFAIIPGLQFSYGMGFILGFFQAMGRLFRKKYI
jgi:glycosyltransferase involved in cell wall biosynthesis